MSKRSCVLGVSSLLLFGAASCADLDPGDGAPTSGQVVGAGQVKSRTNSLVRLPRNQYFADVDGDGIAELVSTNSNQLFVNRNDHSANGFAHHYFDHAVRELAVGHFTGGAKQELCAFLDNDWFECIRWTSNDLGFETWLSTGPTHPTSPSIMTPTTSERMIVGDFNGDAKDDILLHKPSNGATRFISVRTDLGCDPDFGCGPVFALLSTQRGDLDKVPDRNFPLRNVELYAGQFGGSAGQDDILVLDRSNGRVYRLDALQKTVQTSMPPFIISTVTTFQLAMTTTTNQIASAEALAIGNVDGSTTDAIVAYTASTSATRFLKASSGTTLSVVPMLPSQLAGPTASGSRPFLGKMSKWPGEPGTDVREDILFYDAGTQQYVRSDARWWNGNTYWWAYTQNIRRYDLEFPPLGPKRDRLILLCTDSDVPAQSWYTLANYNWLYGRAGRNVPAMYNFFKDMSYGTENYNAVVKGIFPLAQAQSTVYRDVTWNACIAASGVDTSAYYRTVVITNGEDDFGSFRHSTVATLASWQSTWTGGPTHEMGHGMGLPHDFLDHPTSGNGEYGDASDAMGSPYAYVWGVDFKLPGGTGLSVATGYASFSRSVLGYIPPARQVKYVSSGTPTTATVELAALDRPESIGALVVSVQLTSDPNDIWMIDLRSKRGRWDSALPGDGVMIRHTVFDAGWGQTIGKLEWLPRPFMLPGDTFTEGGITMHVVSLDSENGRAIIQVTY